MTTGNSLLKDYLQSRGHSYTKTRAAVFTALQRHQPVTMLDLYRDVSTMLDRASLYRTIALFESIGIVQRLQHGWKYTLELTDAFSPHHHHLTCEKCGQAISFDEPEALDSMIEAIAAIHGFKPQTHQLEIGGLCRNCQET